MRWRLLNWLTRWWRILRPQTSRQDLEALGLADQVQREAERIQLEKDVAWTEQYLGGKTWVEDGRTYKLFPDGQVGEDITGLDVTDLTELTRVYGRTVPLHLLEEWAEEARVFTTRQEEIRARLEEIGHEPLPPLVDDGYRPAGGALAGTSAAQGVVYPAAVTELTTKEWADLTLEQAYGLGKMPRFPGASQGYSMRYLNDLKNKAQHRRATAYEVAILRSRGLI